jgi:hypothetical protein
MEGDERRSWTLLSSHGHVLVEIARNPRARVRDLSAVIGITERATQSIIADLEQAGYVERRRIGRRTRYVLNPDHPFRHSAQDGLQVGPFLELLTGTAIDGDAAGAAGMDEIEDTAGTEDIGDVDDESPPEASDVDPSLAAAVATAVPVPVLPASDVPAVLDVPGVEVVPNFGTADVEPPTPGVPEPLV